MDQLTARPSLLKQVNLSRIRRIIKEKGSATRAEIASDARLSSTTVRSLLTEMLKNGEIKVIGLDESSGGRKAERYSFCPNRYYCVAFCITEGTLHCLLINICGEIVQTSLLKTTDENQEAAIISFLDPLLKDREIKSIGIGIPGIVDGKSYWRLNRKDNGLCQYDLGKRIAHRYGLPVIMENDLNATAIGLKLCYEKEFPCEDPERTNMAYLYFENGCVSAGFIAEGRILHGHRNFAGELGLIPIDEDLLLGQWMTQSAESGSDAFYVRRVAYILSWICGVLNPQYIVLGGPDLRKDCIGPIGENLSSLLPEPMDAEILYSSDLLHDYYNGMAYLATSRIFDEIQLIKE